jgi:protein O-GlcNAc transferase
MKIICYSLWGNKAEYVINAIRNADVALTLFPEWKCRYYISPNVKSVFTNELNKRNNVELIFQDRDEQWNGMFWRFGGAKDAVKKSDVMICRDVDSLLNIRDKACVDEWLNSDKDFHIVRDNCAHGTKIMGGIWGVRNGLLSNIKELIDNYSRKDSNNRKNIDQEFLRDIIYPRVINNALVHDPYHFYNDNGKPMPIPRKGPFHLNKKPTNEDWPDISSPWRTEKVNGLVFCGNCNMVHDNDYIGKFAVNFTEEDKQKYPFGETE